MPKVEFSKYNINILHVVKFIFTNGKSCKRDIQGVCNAFIDQQNKKCELHIAKAS